MRSTTTDVPSTTGRISYLLWWTLASTDDVQAVGTFRVGTSGEKRMRPPEAFLALGSGHTEVSAGIMR